MATVQKWLPDALGKVEGLRAAKWVRVSTEGQTENYGPGAQRDLIESAIKRHKLIDSGVIWEVAHSGRSVTKTPLWHDMLARAGKDYDVLVVAYASRFQRNLKLTLVSVEDELHPAGVPVLFADEEILTSDPNHWDQFVREAHEAERSSRKLGRRVGEGYRRKRAVDGIPGGNRPPYGFERTTDKPQRLVIDPVRMATVRRAFVLSAAGRTDGQVAESLSLKKSHVAEILTNPVYKGTLRKGGVSAGGVVIDPTLWDRVQERRATYSHREHGKPALRTYPLAKLLHCRNCGRMLTAHTGRFRHTQVCEPFKAAKPENVRWATRGESYSDDLYDSIIPAILAHVSANAELAEAVISQIERRVTGPDPATLSRIERERNAALESYKRDRDTPGLTAAMSRLDSEDATARKVVRELPSAEDAGRFLSDLPRLWAASDLDNRQQLARALFDRIEVMGVEEVRIVPTREALDYGWFEAWAGKTLRVPLDAASLRYGRGERI